MFRLATFGRLALSNGPASDVAVPRRQLAMLALLASAGDRGLTRDKLVAYLWPESSADDARHSLDQLLYSLRRQVGASVFLGPDPLRLNSEVVSSDVAAFEAAVKRGADSDAVAEHAGPFLDGFYLKGAAEFGRWVEDERARLSAAYGAALERLAENAVRAGDARGAVAAWRRLVAVDRLSARYAYGLVRAMAAAGDRPEALRTASAYESLVRQELGVAVDPPFAKLMRDLRSVNGEAATSAEPSGASPEVVSQSGAPRQQFTDDPPSRSDPPAATAKRRPRSRFTTPRYAIATTLALGGAALLVTARHRAPETAPHRHNVAVTVFENRTGDPSLDIVGNMVADYTSNALFSTGMVDVADPSFDFWQLQSARRGTRPSPSTLHKQTGATIVVLGEYYRDGDSLLFVGRGVDATSDRVIFGFDSVRASVREPRQAVEQVRQHVMSAIATHVDATLVRWAGNEGKPPVRFEAYQEFAEGMARFVDAIAAQGETSPHENGFARANAHLANAFRRDSTYYVAALWWFWARYNDGDRIGADTVLETLARHRLAMSPYERALYDYNVALVHGTPEQRFRIDSALVRFAPASEFLFCLTRDALESGHPREALSVIKKVDDSYTWARLVPFPPGFRVRALVEQGDFAGAVRLARRLDADTPGDVSLMYPEIDALTSLGRLDDVEELVERSSHDARVSNASFPNVLLYAGLRLQANGRREPARRLFMHALTAYETNTLGGSLSEAVRFGRGRSLYYLERWDAAREVLEPLASGALGTSRYDWRALSLLGSLAARAGDTAEVSRIRELLGRRSVNPAAAKYLDARVAAVRGEQSTALRFLAAAISLGAQAEEFVTEGDAAPSMEPDFAALRASPLFRTTVGRW